jgi:hypothetical protein
MILNDCKLMVGPQGKHWIAPPAVRQTDADGHVKRDAGGKATWSRIIEFIDKETRDRFSEMVLEALRRDHPDAFDGDGP